MEKGFAFLVSPSYIGWACTHCAWAYPGGISVRPEQIMDMQREFNGHWCGDYSGISKTEAPARPGGEATVLHPKDSDGSQAWLARLLLP